MKVSSADTDEYLVRYCYVSGIRYQLATTYFVTIFDSGSTCK